MNVDDLPRELHRSADAALIHRIDSQAIIEQAGRIRRRRRAIAAACVAVLVAAGTVVGVLAAEDRGQVAVIAPQPIPSPIKTPLPSSSPSPTPSLSALPTTKPRRLNLPAGWTSAGSLVNAASLTWAAVGSNIVYWGAQIGQDASSGYSGQGQMFDLSTRAWSAIPSSPVPARDNAASAGSGRFFFVWGGDQAAPTLTPEEQATVGQATGRPARSDGATFDVVTRTWHVLPRSPLKAQIPLGASWNGQEFVVVGTTQTAAYNPQTDSWRLLPTLPPKPLGLTSASVIQVAERTYVIGAYSYYLTAGDAAWTEIPSLQHATVSTLTTATDGTSLFAAAIGGGDVMVDRFDPSAQTWTPLPANPIRPVECLIPFAVTPHSVFAACGTSAVFDRGTGTWLDYGTARSWGGDGPSDVGGSDAISVGSAIVFPGAPTLIYEP